MADQAPTAAEELGILARRRIEAAIIAPIFDELSAEIGEERAQDLLRRAIRRAAIEAGREFAAKTRASSVPIPAEAPVINVTRSVTIQCS